MTYVFACSDCGSRFELSAREAPGCYNCGSTLRRDYRAEGVGFAVSNLRQARTVDRETMKRAILPHNDDFKGPDDPDGTKGMRKWREEFQPRASNKNPDWPGHVEKRTF